MTMVEVRLQDGSVIQVPYPRVPPAPSIGSRRHEEIARQWLVSLSQAPSPQRVEALAPLAGRFHPHSPLGRIASQFVAANRLPVTEDVVAAYLYRQAARRRHVVPLGPILQATRERVLDLIDEHWAEHGQGPSWSHWANRPTWTATRWRSCCANWKKRARLRSLPRPARCVGPHSNKS